MGEVFLVEHLQLRRMEALKVLRRDIAERPRVLSRFRREARALYRLDHPNIMSVYEFGTLPNGRRYLSAEYAEGRSLRTALRAAGALPMTTVVRLLKQLASAVAHAHSRGVIHRDLKPENLMLAPDKDGSNALKVLDFGIAKIVAPDYQDSIEITNYGSIRGTPHYMSPEQARGENQDARVDIYAIGCIAFELATGKPPFRGPSAIAVMRSHVRDIPPGLSAQPDGTLISGQFQQIVHCCLAKNPDDRFQTGKELLAALDQLAETAGGKPTVPAEYQSHESAPVSLSTLIDIDSDTWVGTVNDLASGTTADSPGTATLTWELTEPGGTLEEELADVLIELGCGDIALSVQLCLVRDLRSDMNQLSIEAAQLARQHAQITQRLRQSDGAARYSLGELRFEHDNPPPVIPPLTADTEPSVGSLKKRLLMARVALAHELGELEARVESIRRDRQSLEREFGQTLAELRQLAIYQAAAHAREPHIAALLHRLRAA